MLVACVPHSLPPHRRPRPTRRTVRALQGPRDHRVAPPSRRATPPSRPASPQRRRPDPARSHRRRTFPDPNGPAGSSPPTPCCAGTDDASPAIGPRPPDHRDGHQPPSRYGGSSCASQPTTPPGATGASKVNSPVSATRSLNRRCGGFSRPTASSPPPIDPRSPGRSSCTPRPRWPATSSPSTPPCSAGTTCCSSSTSPPAKSSTPAPPLTPPAPGPPKPPRNLFLHNADRLSGSRAVVRDRGSEFIDTFDEIFRTEGFKVLKTPVRTPVANAFAERWIGSIRRELLDRTIIWNQRQLERVVIDYIGHYNTHRPHRSLDQRPPRQIGTPKAPEATDPHPLPIVRTARCDGLINEYRNAA